MKINIEFIFKEEKDKEVDGEKKEKKEENKEGGARNLWVSGLSGDTRAKDLKQLCSKHGKVNKQCVIKDNMVNVLLLYFWQNIHQPILVPI